jgi:hypothetical protein
MGSDATTIRHLSESSKTDKRMKVLVNRVLHDMKYYVKKSGLDVCRLMTTLEDGSFVNCLYVHGTNIVEVFTPTFTVVPILEEEFGEIKNLYIILSSAKDETYIVGFSLNPTVGKSVRKVGMNTTYFPAPNDLLSLRYTHISPFVYTLNHTEFIIAVNADRKEWHNNAFKNNNAISYGRYSTYYECVTGYNSGSYIINFSFSPYTYKQGLSHVGRYIDQEKNFYIPILGTSAAFAAKYPKLFGCVDAQYGKKPFTLTNEGMVSYREVVKPTIEVNIPPEITLLLYWPFVPYIHEVAGLNLQRISGDADGKRSLHLQTICNFYEYDSDPIRKDSAVGLFPSPVMSQNDISTFNTTGTTSGERTRTNSYAVENSHNIERFATLGTVGNKKDLFVKTTLSGRNSTSVIDEENVSRVSNFPSQYYMAEFYDDLFWNCCRRDDVTTGKLDHVVDLTNEVTGEQFLKVGDIVIDSGKIEMKYNGKEESYITHDGMASRETDNCPASIGYGGILTIPTRSVLELVALTALGEETNYGTFVKISGGGGVTITGTYTAPATNEHCVDNATIALMSCNPDSPDEEMEIDRVYIGINGSVTEDQAFNVNLDWSPECEAAGTCEGPGTTCFFNPSTPDCVPCAIASCHTHKAIYSCSGALLSSSIKTAQCTCCASSSACNLPDAVYDCWNVSYSVAAFHNSGPIDCRTEAMKHNGCCPAWLPTDLYP